MQCNSLCLATYFQRHLAEMEQNLKDPYLFWGNSTHIENPEQDLKEPGVSFKCESPLETAVL